MFQWVEKTGEISLGSASESSFTIRATEFAGYKRLVVVRVQIVCDKSMFPDSSSTAKTSIGDWPWKISP